MTVSKTVLVDGLPWTPPPPLHIDLDKKLMDLGIMSFHELVELYRRQKKLLNNKAFMFKLPDNGAKIRALNNMIVAELELRHGEQNAKRMLEGPDSFFMQGLEWHNFAEYPNNYLDSDDDSDEEVQQGIRSCPLLTEMLQKNVTRDQPEVQMRNIFKPYKTTTSDVHNPEKEITRKKSKNWEVTAATPPPIVHGPTKLLTLEESIKLQKENNEHLKAIQATRAEEKLRMIEITIVDSPEIKTNFGAYRDAVSDDSDSSDSEDSENEVFDEEPERGGVVFNIMN